MTRLQSPKGKRLTINPNVSNEIFIFRSVGKAGQQRVHKFHASSFELAKEKAILKYSNVIHFKQKPMDLMEARKRAAKASLDAKRTYYVIYDGDDGECSVNTAPLRGAAHKFTNGLEDKTYKPTKSEEERPKDKTLPAQSARAKKLVDAKTAKESAEEDSTETNKTTSEMEKAGVKKSAKKVAAKPTKKVATSKKATVKKATVKKEVKLINGKKPRSIYGFGVDLLAQLKGGGFHPMEKLTKKYGVDNAAISFMFAAIKSHGYKVERTDKGYTLKK